MLKRVMTTGGNEIRAVFGGATRTHARLRDHLLLIAIATIGVDIVCSVITWLIERHGSGTQIHSFGAAVFWTTSQLLTVSSSLQNPISTGGRILDVFMEIYAITVVASLAGGFGAFLQRRGVEQDGAAAKKPADDRR
jgi:hypothetical protein